MSQPALTRSIKRVEDVLGVRLFERTTRTVRLTTAGCEFVALARRMTDDLRIATRAMRELADQERGQVIVSCLMSVAHGVLPKAIAAYRQARPGIEIHVRDGIHASVIEDTRSGMSDFGLTYLQDVPEGLISSRLGQGHFDLVAHQDSVFGTTGKSSIPFDSLRGVPLVSLPPGSQTRRLLDATAAGRGFALTHVAVVSQIPTLLSFVRAGVGVRGGSVGVYLRRTGTRPRSSVSHRSPSVAGYRYTASHGEDDVSSCGWLAGGAGGDLGR